MLQLYGHPFSSYTWKAQIALLEKDIPYAFRVHDAEHADNVDALRGHWPPGKFPVLVDGDRPVIESSIIIEYLDLHCPGSRRLVPEAPEAALAARFLDRVFDNHVMGPMQAVVGEYLIDAQAPDRSRIDRACAALDTIYAWLDEKLGDGGWACGADFTIADCAAAPALFYADWVRPIGPAHARLNAYRARLLARPSVARCVDDARPYRPFFPPGAPDRD
ncbi:MAG: glutathione S-transferase family protein [Sphingomonadaceae bacterium]|nr:glutathione S-transferase family protein [Sphingomonadaceae bacterium]